MKMFLEIFVKLGVLGYWKLSMVTDYLIKLWTDSKDCD